MRRVDPVGLLPQLLEAAGWRVEEIRGGFRATGPGSAPKAVLGYLEGPPPSGFQQEFPRHAAEIFVLFGQPAGTRDRDRVELTGAKVVEPEELPQFMVQLLHPAPIPAPESPARGEERSSALPSEAGGRTGIEEGDLLRADLAPPSPIGWQGRDDDRERPVGPLLSAPEAFPPSVFEVERIVRPRLHEEDIHQMATGRWRGGSPRLVLVPFLLFAYALREDDEAPGAPPRLVAVPAVGGPAQFWPPGEREIVSALPGPHRRWTPRIGKAEARASALAAVQERHARVEEHAEQRRSLIVIESLRRPRDPSEVRLGPPTRIWVPHWIIEAWNGREVLDAVTGLPAQLPNELEGAEP